MAKGKIEGWQTVVDHVNSAWKRAKGVDFNYPWNGKAIQDLAHQARNYTPWGVMALWDLYIEEADDYVKKMGYDLNTFIRQLPRLLDRKWKPRAAAYEAKFFPAKLPPALETTLFEMPNFIKQKKRVVIKSRMEWLKNKKSLKNHGI